MARVWAADRDEIAWGDESWTLRLDDPRPGLYSARGGPLLGLEGLARTGLSDRSPFAGPSLESRERLFDRVIATYRPEGWDELSIKASWFPVGEDGMGLEVEVSARSVDRLKKIELLILSALGEPPPVGSLRSVEPRDREAAGLTYDGRETDLDALVTGPPGSPIGPWLASKTGRDGWAYVEATHPQDASRRISEGRLPFSAVRYGLFGYDLERGVVVRGRVRGFWLPSQGAFEAAESRFRAFLDEPPPLTT